MQIGEDEEALVKPIKLLKERNLGQHKGMVRSVNFSQDSTMLLTAGQDPSLKLWDVETSKLITNLSSASKHVKFYFSLITIFPL